MNTEREWSPDHSVAGHSHGYAHEESGEAIEDMQSLMDAEYVGFQALRRRQNVKGIVVSVQEDFVLVDVGTKSEGIIRREELFDEEEDQPELKYGQEVLVQVLEPDSPNGPILSLKRARREQAWEDMGQLASSGGVISGPIVDFNRGGAILEYRGVRGFIPLSQLTSLPPSNGSDPENDDTSSRLAQLQGQRLTVKVLEVERSQNRLILSERAAQTEERDRVRKQMLDQIAAGQIRRGTVRNITSFGAFIDLGGLDGLVHVSEMGFERIDNPRDVLQTGQEVDVYVMEVRPSDGRIALSIKRAMADPWLSVKSRLQPGQTVDVVIRRLTKFGAFAQVEPGVEGLIHITELADTPPRDPSQVVQEGQAVKVKLIHIDESNRRLGLSLRQMAVQEVDMTADDWHREQETSDETRSSAFDVLSTWRPPDEHEEPVANPPSEVPTEPAKPKRTRKTAKAAAESNETDRVETEPDGPPGSEKTEHRAEEDLASKAANFSDQSDDPSAEPEEAHEVVSHQA